ncbi:Os09g0262000 [Oryza sativa Japonica Group]|uniref:Os09g0262000 protein n=1 Tax=Oryza sativa subsp. japonica TaxID=39947 RepID=A0A0P0XKI8_ORYSJ|nr:Os09g0262000 [Oryza sativa Japonica Group]
MAKAEGGKMVCVTGAGGFIGSWVVKELLLRGYAVRGTARDPYVMDYDSLSVAFNGCEGVFHVASPVSVDPRLVPVAVEGTKNVINAAADMGVRRVVFTSTFGAVHMDPNRSHDTVVDESCWSNLEFCKQKDWYCYAKTVAEMVAAEQASKRGIQLVVVLPAMTLGQMLQSTINPSIRHIADFLNGSRKTHRNAVAGYVDARDVARAHALVYEDPKAHGRYLCIASVLHRSELIQMIRELFPQYPITCNKCEDSKQMVQPFKFSNQRLRDLGLTFTPIKETEGAQQAGNLPVPEGCTDPVANNFDPTAMSNDSICLYTF